jgi:ADP-sugar diphosphatase
MSKFILPGSSPPCTVFLPANLTEEQLFSFRPFKNWLSALQHALSLQDNDAHTFHAAPYKLRSITVQSVDFFTKERIGFMKLQSEITNDNREWLPGAVFLRGGSVAMMVRDSYPFIDRNVMEGHPMLSLILHSKSYLCI